MPSRSISAVRGVVAATAAVRGPAAVGVGGDSTHYVPFPTPGMPAMVSWGRDLRPLHMPVGQKCLWGVVGIGWPRSAWPWVAGVSMRSCVVEGRQPRGQAAAATMRGTGGLHVRVRRAGVSDAWHARAPCPVGVRVCIARVGQCCVAVGWWPLRRQRGTLLVLDEDVRFHEGQDVLQEVLDGHADGLRGGNGRPPRCPGVARPRRCSWPRRHEKGPPAARRQAGPVLDSASRASSRNSSRCATWPRRPGGSLGLGHVDAQPQRPGVPKMVPLGAVRAWRACLPKKIKTLQERWGSERRADHPGWRPGHWLLW